jgi:hypothetical protein
MQTYVYIIFLEFFRDKLEIEPKLHENLII